MADMMKLLVMPALAVFLCVAGCEGYNIERCGHACKEAGSRMVKWSPTDGCVCDAMQKASK